MPPAVRRLLILILCLFLLAVGWRYLINTGNINENSILKLSADWLYLEKTLWGLLVISLIYVCLLAVMFPLTLLVIATGMLFSVEWALFTAMAGSMMSSAISYFLGHRLGRETLEKYGGKRVSQAEQFIQQNSLSGMIVINLLPIAPFTVTNMLAGAFKLDFKRYMLGSAIGLFPGLYVVVVLGGQLNRLFTNEINRQDFVALGSAVGLLAIFFILLWIVNYFVKRQRK